MRALEQEALDRLQRRPVQHEAKEQAALSKWAKAQWWGRGYTHHDAATESWLTARSRHAAGVRGGWPDVTVMVPQFFVRSLANPTGPLYLALELKRESLRPKKRSGLWWLAWAREFEADDSWHIKPTEPTRHGLKARQAEQLAYMHACGWETMVAYGWDEARAWLETQIGPQPERLPEGM